MLVARLQGVLDQQAAKSGAIDVKIRLDPLPAVEGQRVDESVFGLQRHGFDAALGALDAARLGRVLK